MARNGRDKGDGMVRVSDVTMHDSIAYDDSDNRRAVYFDMDGTIADLYGVSGWLDCLRSDDPSPYEEAMPLVDMSDFERLVNQLQMDGWHVGIVTWLSKGGSKSFDKAATESKLRWVKRNLPLIDEFKAVPYGTPKQDVVDCPTNAVLVDDEDANLDGWSDKGTGRTTINASNTCQMIAALENMTYQSDGCE